MKVLICVMSVFGPDDTKTKRNLIQNLPIATVMTSRCAFMTHNEPIASGRIIFARIDEWD
jgi:hypothetical protein